MINTYTGVLHMLPAAIADELLKAIKETTPKHVVRDIRMIKKEYGRPAQKGKLEVKAVPEKLKPITPVKRFITDKERRLIELKLHRLLIWVGIMTPVVFEWGDRKLPLHDIVWDLMSKECLTEEEKTWVRKLIWKLTAHVKVDEDILHNKKITMDEAKAIYTETAGLIRAIISLKGIICRKDYCPVRNTVNIRRVDDAQYWLNFLRQIT